MAKAVRFFHKGTTMFNGSAIAASYKLFQYQTGTTKTTGKTGRKRPECLQQALQS